MADLWLVLVYATLAGATIPLGGFLASVEHVRPRWREEELRHTVIAFGGGVLLAAVALVLVPEGRRVLPAWASAAAVAGGGILFMFVDRRIAARGGSAAQLLAMLLDFVPESIALGALLTQQPSSGLLLALLIGWQNFPEGFNAYRELRASGMASGRILAGFALLVLLGPAAAALGYLWLRELPAVLGVLMLISAGGILYLTFQDIAPQARLERHWAPPLGAVFGFLLGMTGQQLLG
jgi:ZIP family zinc transporter